MALDDASLTLDDSQASLASMPEELWRKVTSYLRPATTARAFVVASGSSSLQNALRAEIEQTERAMFGMTRREAEELLVDDREEAVTKLAVIKELILYLVLATHKHMRPPRATEAELDAVYDLFKTQEAALGTTYFDVLARYLRSLDNWARDERFVRYQVMAGGDTEEIMERVKEFASSIMALHISTRTFLCRRGEPPPDAAADEPEGGLEAYARHFM